VATRAAERAGPDSDVGLLAEHKSRYRFAANTTAPQRLLDIACGSGLGFWHFPDVPLVVGADLEVDALRLADDARAGAPNAVALARTDGTALPFRSGAFDVITSFETVEHIPDDESFLMELARVLSPHGALLMSTPNAIITGPSFGVPRNPFHIREYKPAQFRDLLLASFADVTLLGQRVIPSFGPCPLWDQGPGLPWKNRLSGFLWKLQRHAGWSPLLACKPLARSSSSLTGRERVYLCGFRDRKLPRYGSTMWQTVP
jgi:SAM-dependent methyltransferase